MDIDLNSGGQDTHAAGATSAPTKENTTTMTNGSPSPSINRNYKYLTNSQLLNLQLQDPEIRIHFLTQFLIISSYLSSSVSTHRASTATAPSAPVPSTNVSPARKRNTATTTTATTSTTTNKASVICKSIVDQLAQLDKRANMLLRQTPPNGEMHAKTLDWILSERESVWKQWKKNKCQPAIERFMKAVVVPADSTVAVADPSTKSVTMSSSVIGKTMATATTSSKKRSATAMEDGSQRNGGRDTKRVRNQGSSSSSSSSNKNTMESKSEFYSFKIDIRKDLPTLSCNITKKHTPDLHTYLEEYVEALDPEAGIEAEYHPKNDKLFAWRALRLLARDHAGDFGRSTMSGPGSGTMIRRENGDFEGMVRSIWKDERGINIPGEMPKAEVINDDEEEDKNEDKKEGKKEDMIEDMILDTKEGTKEDKTEVTKEDKKEVTKEDMIEVTKEVTKENKKEVTKEDMKEEKIEDKIEDKKEDKKEDMKEAIKEDKKEEGDEDKKEKGDEDIDLKLGVAEGDDGKDGDVEMKDAVIGISDNENQLKTDPLTASVSSNGESDDLFPPSPTPGEHFGPQEFHESEIAAEPITAEQSSSNPKTTSIEGNMKATKQPCDPQPLPSKTQAKQVITESKAIPEKQDDLKLKQAASPNKVTTNKHHSGKSSNRTGSESTRNSKKEDTKEEQVRKDVNGAAPRPTPSNPSRANPHGDCKKENMKQIDKTPPPMKHENAGKEKESSQKESSTQAKNNQNNASARKKDDNVHNRYNGGSRQNHLPRSPLEGNTRHERDPIPHGRHNSPNEIQNRHRSQQHGRGPPPPRRVMNGSMREPAREPMRDNRDPNRGSGFRRPNQDMNGGQQHMGNSHTRDHGAPRERPHDFDRRGGNNRSGHGPRIPPRRDR